MDARMAVSMSLDDSFKAIDGGPAECFNIRPTAASISDRRVWGGMRKPVGELRSSFDNLSCSNMVSASSMSFEDTEELREPLQAKITDARHARLSSSGKRAARSQSNDSLLSPKN